MLEGAETLLARSAAFRTKVGAGDVAAAKLKIYFGELAESLDLVQGATLGGKRPCALMGVDAHGYIQIGQGARIELGGTGAVWMLLLDNPAQPDSHKASLLDFLDWTSTVLDEISDDVGRDDRWPFNHIVQALEPYRPPLGDRKSDDYWLVGYLLSHHVNAPGG
jgi:hypothetical protein